MTTARNKELAELLPVHVMRLTNTNMGLSLMDWNEISNDILDAARLLGALAPPAHEEIEAIRAKIEESGLLLAAGASLRAVHAEALHKASRTLLRHTDRLTSLVRAMLENDPNELAADGGITVLDVWRKDARAALKAEAV